MKKIFAGDIDLKVSRRAKTGMIYLMVCSFLFVTVAGIAMCIPTSADAELYDKVIRFHVIANSDSHEDQSLKINIRDAVLEQYSELLSGYESKQRAVEDLESKLEQIRVYSEGKIKELGFDYKCNIFLGTEYYPRTEYESFTMPAGSYTSLRIVIGEGEGKNWWCVLFPPLCTKAALKQEKTDKEAFIEAGFTGDQFDMITKNDKPKYRLKFRLLELFFG